MSANLHDLPQFAAAAQRLYAMGRAARETLDAIEADRAERVRLYRVALQAFDWHYAMSDYAPAWREGEHALAALREQQAELDPTGAIWRSVAPAGASIPQPIARGTP